MLTDRLLKLEILFVNNTVLRFRLLEFSATDHTIYLWSLKLSNRLLCQIKDNISILTQGKVFFLKITFLVLELILNLFCVSYIPWGSSSNLFLVLLFTSFDIFIWMELNFNIYPSCWKLASSSIIYSLLYNFAITWIRSSRPATWWFVLYCEAWSYRRRSLWKLSLTELSSAVSWYSNTSRVERQILAHKN